MARDYNYWLVSGSTSGPRVWKPDRTTTNFADFMVNEGTALNNLRGPQAMSHLQVEDRNGCRFMIRLKKKEDHPDATSE